MYIERKSPLNIDHAGYLQYRKAVFKAYKLLALRLRPRYGVQSAAIDERRVWTRMKSTWFLKY